MEEADQEPILSCFTRISRANEEPPTSGIRWIRALRTRFSIWPDRLEFGDRTVPLEELGDVKVYRLRSMFGFHYGRVLAFSHKAKDFWQVGIPFWVKWPDDLPFAVEEISVRMRYSAFSIVLRITLIILIAAFAWMLLR